MSVPLKNYLPILNTRWRQARRMFDGRIASERRLITLAVLGLAWFVMDTAWITPAYKNYQTAAVRKKTITAALDTLQQEAVRRQANDSLKDTEAQQEAKRLRQQVADNEVMITKQDEMLAPAREMRNLLEGLLAQNGHLKVRKMRSLPAEEVKFSAIPGMSIAQKQLYRQSMEVSVQGGYMDLLTWLRSVEEMPRKLLWDGLSLRADEQSKLTLSLRVHTFSPDRDALEITP